MDVHRSAAPAATLVRVMASNSDNDSEPSHGAPRTEKVQADVNAHFDSSASYWDGVYRGDSLQGAIYQRRQAAVLEYVDAAGLVPGSRALEIGCGAGHLTIELVERGLGVVAVDASQAMVESTAERAREAGLSDRVTVESADVHALPYGDGEFALVVAVGVIPWLHSPAAAVAEISRVLRPGGELVLTCDNRARVISFTDPRAILALSPLRDMLVARRARAGLASSRLHYPHTIDDLLTESSLQPLAGRTVGFGPLSFLGRPIFSEARAMRVDARLQGLADRDVPGVRSTGWHYIVRARRL